MEEHRSARSEAEGLEEPVPFDPQNRDHRQIIEEMVDNPASLSGTVKIMDTVRERYRVVIDVDVAFTIMQRSVERKARAGDPDEDET